MESLAHPSGTCSFSDFVEQVYLPFFCRKWKGSTRRENEGRIGYHLTSEFAPKSLRSFSRDELQGLLDLKAALSLSFSVVDHLRWDLNQVFGMAVAEGYLQRNPASFALHAKGVSPRYHPGHDC